ncbi:hypothetical protein SteCoe_28559 [Stentor coeruleus]|uniref:Ankyrin repeat domain-containing protein n=1 Tax=Stentor coeruleus TaxID=5963 RepID=A0A1R2B893_9CILI|nr:hypothetical protein SteCoe_28559 [Stentor coeruleus]
MEDWNIDTEENSLEDIKVPIFKFEYNQAKKDMFTNTQEDDVPSDDEPIKDRSILEFPNFNIQKEVISTVSCSESIIYSTYTLSMMVFRGDLDSIHEMWQSDSQEFQNAINEPDLRGNTPVMLACKLASTKNIYEKILKFLLFHGGCPTTKDLSGWSLMDQAVCIKNKNIVSAIFDQLYKEKMHKWVEHKNLVLETLRKLPDFYMELNWEFDSSVIPLVSKIAPHDVCKFWKYGTAFRVDTSLVGWKKLRSKRRHMSFYFKPKDYETNVYEEIFLVNHSKETIVYLFEPLDPEEKSVVVNDIINTEPMQGDVKLLSYKFKPCLNWRNNHVTQKLGPWDTNKYKISYKGQMKYKKKAKNVGPCVECDYFNIEVDDPVAVQFSFPSQNEPTRTIIKKSKAFLWQSTNFPFTLQDFLPILAMIGEANTSVKKLYNFLSNENLLQKLSPNSFPVKVDIPLTLSVKAVVTFDKFQLITDDKSLEVPNYSLQSRKVAQKILTCPKKRLLLMNLVI